MYYNPHFPRIIGEEWVAIRNEELQFSPAVSAVELGYEFIHNSGADSISRGRYYINKFAERITPSSLALFLTQPFFISLYAAGTEAETGPINVVRVPVMSGTLTNGSLSNAATVQEALASPTDGRKIIMSATTIPVFSSLDLYFATRQMDQLLQNKRIVGINVVYNAAICATCEPNTSYLGLHLNNGSQTFYGTATFNEQGTMRLGDTNWGFSVTQPGLSFPTPFPWTPTSIRRFDQADANNIETQFIVDSDEATVEAQQFDLYYVAMDIYYCEEKRIYMGGSIAVNQGANNVLMYTPNEVSSSFALDYKKYLVTLSAADTGDSRGSTSNSALLAQPYPSLNALRQLYPNKFHRGIQVNRPSPLGSSIIGKTFTSEEVDVIPQITLHKTGTTPDVITTVHPYGRMIGAQVYGTLNVEQTIEDFNIGTNTDTQQVRFYARRFGNTTAPLKLTRGSSIDAIISLTPAEFDAIEPEDGIIDGWKEITLDMISDQGFSGTRPAFHWTSSAETAGNRWEILGLLAPSVSGTPLSQYTPAPAAYNLGVATYGLPISGGEGNGALDFLTWMKVPPSAPVSAVASDQSADAVLMFAVTPPAVTGITLTEMSQALTGIADECVDCQTCVPTSLTYNHIEWDMGMTDTFNRTESNGWGTSDTGNVWTVDDPGDTDTFSVSDGEGIVFLEPGASSIITNDRTLSNVEVMTTFSLTQAISGTTGDISISLLARYVDSNNHYRARILIDGATGSVELRLIKTVAGSSTTFIEYLGTISTGPDVRIRAIFNVTDNVLRLTVHVLDVDDNIVKTISFFGSDSAEALSSGTTGLFFATDASTSAYVAFEDYCAYVTELSDGGYYEMQRMDELADWQTIMRGSPCSWYMNDYEARVGIESTYRMRIVDGMNFAGSWSSEIVNTLSSPGVSGGACVDGVSTLIFTSNAAQDGRYNLAYTQVWEQQVSEDFNFPEATTVSLNRVYQRDFAVAFKGTERGGEQFGRNLLVHNAAVAPERLANIKSLRDMAWADVPYICVRDEIGDRWFAFVQVPAENVRRNRRLYVAAIVITKVTDTPYAVDPVVNT
jgi:hypothetical protein